MSHIVTISRRHVLKAGISVGAGCCLALHGVAGAQRRGALPTGQSGDVLSLEAAATYDLSVLAPGEMIAFQNGNNFIGVVHRNDEQRLAAQNNASLSAADDGDIVTDARFLVVDLRCQHRGCQVGYTGEADAMFECPCHRTSFDAAGRVLPERAKTDQDLTPIAHRIDGQLLRFI